MGERGPVKSVHEGTSEESIVNEVWRLADGQGLNAQMMAFQMEMTRRNNVALREFKASRGHLVEAARRPDRGAGRANRCSHRDRDRVGVPGLGPEIERGG